MATPATKTQFHFPRNVYLKLMGRKKRMAKPKNFCEGILTSTIWNIIIDEKKWLST